jgi:hydroxymethylbilane synthase
MEIVIGSRGSKLALWQAGWVQQQLVNAGFAAEIRVIKTSGDKLANVPLTEAGTKGLFVKEIEEALAAGEIDVAVHSFKDLPVDQPEGLHVAAVPVREDARDVLISRQNIRLTDLPKRARVGTSSLRRQAQGRGLRADLEFMAVRGNLDTRIRKLDRGEYDALILAAAGVHRLDLGHRVTEYFGIGQMCPAVGQGALAIELRCDDESMHEAVRGLDDRPSHLAVLAERAALRGLGGGCLTPIAAHAVVKNGTLRLSGVVAEVHGARILWATAEGSTDRPEVLGDSVARQLLDQGARELLQQDIEGGTLARP